MERGPKPEEIGDEEFDPNSDIRKIKGSVEFDVFDIYSDSPKVQLKTDSSYIEVDVRDLTKDLTEYTGLPSTKHPVLNATEYVLDVNEYDKDPEKKEHLIWEG